MKITKTTKSNLITIGMIIVAYIAVMILDSTGVMNSHYRDLIVPLCFYATMAVSLNLVVGILGELSLGHAGFMCLGAFSSAFFTMVVQRSGSTMDPTLRFILAIVIGGIVAGIFGFLIGIPVLRLNGDYLAIVTLGFGEIIKNIINAIYIGKSNGSWIVTFSSQKAIDIDETYIDGAQGITGTPHDVTITIAFIVLLLTVVISLNLINSRSGRAIMSIRDNRIASGSVGIQITKFKMIAFTISSVLAGFAGALYSHNFSITQANGVSFGYNKSILILVFVVLGGIGSTRGSIIAAVVLTLIPEVLRFIGDYRMLIYAIVMIVMMIINWNPTSKAFIEAHNPFKKKDRPVAEEAKEVQ